MKWCFVEEGLFIFIDLTNENWSYYYVIGEAFGVDSRLQIPLVLNNQLNIWPSNRIALPKFQLDSFGRVTLLI